jgi:hypothetical protein
MHCVGPVLFPTSGGITEALHSELNDNLRRILNEGAARGLTKLFTNTINILGVTYGDRPCLRNHLRMSDEDETFPTEIAMVGGLLKWLLQLRACQSEIEFHLDARVGIVQRIHSGSSYWQANLRV